MNEKEQTLLKETLVRLIDRGQIRPSTSNFGSRILFIKKADGTLRLCVDYRDINAITKRNRCPIPNISELRAQVRGAKIFSKFDFRDGYHNLRVHPDSIEKTAFKCRYGLFEYTVMPFGLTNAPAAFSGMMNRIFGDLYDISVIVYLDDIVVFSQNTEDHIRQVTEVLDRFRKHHLHVKLSKCAFFEQEVEFCGHIIDGEGVKVSANKTEALRSSKPDITSKRGIEKFLGVTVWFQDFVPQYAEITRPLTDLLQKQKKFQWGKEQKDAVKDLISKIRSAPVLKHFNPNLKIRISTDASQYAIGGWISQLHADGWHPVVFVSRKLKPAEMNYANPERELLALVYMLEKQGHYLRSGVPVECNFDCTYLEHIQSMEIVNRRLARWILSLQDYNLTVKHISGKVNTVADYLSK